MKIVIELDDTFYEVLSLGKKAKKAKLTDVAVDILFKAVLNGTPLPKGHGRLIDGDALYDQYRYADYDFDKTMEYAPTIIERSESE